MHRTLGKNKLPVCRKSSLYESEKSWGLGKAPDLQIDRLRIKESRPYARAVGFVRSPIFADAKPSGRSILVVGFAVT